MADTAILARIGLRMMAATIGTTDHNIMEAIGMVDRVVITEAGIAVEMGAIDLTIIMATEVETIREEALAETLITIDEKSQRIYRRFRLKVSTVYCIF